METSDGRKEGGELFADCRNEIPKEHFRKIKKDQSKDKDKD